MISNPAHLIIGYHGCDRVVGEEILSGKTLMKPSENKYDWLEAGCYFWENNAKRAFEYARWLAGRKKKPHIEEPFVIGAVLNPGN